MSGNRGLKRGREEEEGEEDEKGVFIRTRKEESKKGGSWAIVGGQEAVRRQSREGEKERRHRPWEGAMG